MISKSTRAKRRKNQSYHQAVASITVSLIDARNGCRFYVVSRPVTPSRSIHLEANGVHQLKRQYRNMLAQCRGMLVVRRVGDSFSGAEFKFKWLEHSGKYVDSRKQHAYLSDLLELRDVPEVYAGPARAA